METEEFFDTITTMIKERRKMTSRLYQTVLGGKAGKSLLQNFVIHRYPIKNLWTRHLMGVGSRVDDYHLRRKFVENCYEEETGALTSSDRHVNTFINFGKCLGLTEEEITDAPMIPATKELHDYNLHVCNNTNVHFTTGAVSVLLLMEGQPPIVDEEGRSMEAVMRDVYGLPREGYEFFTHHASSTEDDEHVSVLEDEHTAAIVELLKRYCTTDELRTAAIDSLRRTIELRHRHFDAIYDNYYDASEPPYHETLN